MSGSVSTDLQTISLCESTTGWTAAGGTNTLNPDIYVQGANSIHNYSASAAARGADFAFTTALTNKCVVAWFALSKLSSIPGKGVDGLRIRLTDASANWSEWDIGGADTIPHTGWIPYIVDTSTTPARSGSTPCNLASMAKVGWRCGGTTTVAAKTYIYFDAFRYGTGLTVYGGSPGSPATFADLYAADLSNAYGIIDKVFGVYFLQGKIAIGSTAAGQATYFKDTGAILVYKDAPVAATFNAIALQGNATGNTEVFVPRCLIKSVGQRFRFLTNAGNITSFEADGLSLLHAGSVQFAAGQTVINSTFDDCGQIAPSTATFENNTILNATDSAGALLWPGGSTVKNCAFLNNDKSIQITQNTTQTFNNLVFDDAAGKYDVNNTSGSGITINLANGANANSYTGSEVTFSSAVSVTLSGLKNPSEVRVFAAGTANEVSGTGAENVTTGTHAFSLSSGQAVDISILALGYQNLRIINYATTVSANIPVSQVIDRQYSNT